MTKSTKSAKKSTKSAKKSTKSAKKALVRKSTMPRRLSSADKADLAAREAEALERAMLKSLPSGARDAAAEADRRHSPGRRAEDRLVEQAALESAHKLEAAQEELGKAAQAIKTAVGKKDAPKERAPTVSSVAEEMIKAGATNEAVLEALHTQFGLDLTAKGHYAGWYRARLVRAGAITKAFADQHRHAAKAEA